LFKSGGVGPMHLVLRDLMVKCTLAIEDTKDEFLAMMESSDLLSTHEFWQSTMRTALASTPERPAADLARRSFATSKKARRLSVSLRRPYRFGDSAPQFTLMFECPNLLRQDKL